MARRKKSGKKSTRTAPADDGAADRPRASPQASSSWLWIGALALFAFGVRLFYLAVARSQGLFDALMLDSEVYVAIAARIARGEGVGDQPYLLSPLYPYLLAPFVDATGQLSMRGFQVVQALFGAATVGLSAAIAQRLSGRAAAIVAGLVTALFGPLIYHDGAILVASLQAFFLTAALGFLLFEPEGDGASLRRSVGHWLGAGVMLGVSAALRPTGLAVAVVVLGVLWGGWLVFRREALFRPLLRSAALLLGLALIVLPFTLRNAVRGGEPVLLSANGGFNFWVGNAEGANGFFRNPPGYDATADPVARQQVVRALGRDVSYREASRWWSGQALDDIRSDLPRWFGLLVDKAVYFAHPHEIAQMYQEFAGYRDAVWLLRFPLDARAILLFALLAPLALWAQGRGGEIPRLRWPLTFVLGYAAVVTLFFVTSRFRVPIMPAATALGAVTAAGLWKLARGPGAGRSRRLLPLAGACLSLLLVSFLLYDTPGAAYRLEFSDPAKLYNQARVLAQQGDVEGAIELWEESLRLREHAVTHFDLSVALFQLSRNEAALEHLLAAVRLDPNLLEGWLTLGQFRAHRGDPRGAIEPLSRVLQIDPNHEEALFRLGEAHLAVGEARTAVDYFQRFLDVVPADHPMRPVVEANLEAALIEADR